MNLWSFWCRRTFLHSKPWNTLIRKTVVKVSHWNRQGEGHAYAKAERVLDCQVHFWFCLTTRYVGCAYRKTHTNLIVPWFIKGAGAQFDRIDLSSSGSKTPDKPRDIYSYELAWYVKTWLWFPPLNQCFKDFYCPFIVFIFKQRMVFKIIRAALRAWRYVKK